MYEDKLRCIFRESAFPVERHSYRNFVLTNDVIRELRQLDYFDCWSEALQRGWYHFKMQVHSLFLFREGGSASYSFLHCPLDVITYREFLAQRCLDDNPLNRRTMKDEYEKVFETSSARSHVTPIRFDFDSVAYREGVHPVAHIHIGLCNEIRLSTNRMDAVSFVLFVMRQMYPECWSRLLSRQNFHHFVKSIRRPGSAIPPQFWNPRDKVELHFA